MQCKNCLLTDDIECVTIDSEGICNYCIRYDYNRSIIEKSKFRIDETVDKIRKKNANKKYDAIVGISGGVDSCYTLLLAVKRYGLRVLALHIDTGWNSEIATRNIKNATKLLGVDLYTYVVFWPSIRSVQRAFFKSGVVNCDIPQDHLFKIVQKEMCKKFDVNEFISGRHFLTDGMMPTSWVFNNSDGYHIKSICKAMKEEMYGYKTSSALISKVWNRFSSFKDIRLLQYIDYSRDLAKKQLKDELNWADYIGKHYESVFTEYYQSYFLFEKFGIDKRIAHLSGQIKNNEITQDTANAMISEMPYSETRILDIEPFFIAKLGFSKLEWESIMASPSKSHESYPNQTSTLKLIQKIMRTIK